MASNSKRRMTIRYWMSLSEGSRERALKFVFPIHQSTVDMLMDEKPDLKSPWWKLVFSRVKIPADHTTYSTCVNNCYLP